MTNALSGPLPAKKKRVCAEPVNLSRRDANFVLLLRSVTRPIDFQGNRGLLSLYCVCVRTRSRPHAASRFHGNPAQRKELT